jgi:KaiC/GvpD/RAD55 family RecA-like ATPase
MDNFRRGIESYLKSVTKRDDLNTLIASIQKQQHDRQDMCTRASEFAAHLIIDLYDETSDTRSNTNRIVTNLENAAHELQVYAKRIKSLGDN